MRRLAFGTGADLELVLEKVARLLQEAAYYEHLSNAAVGITAKKAARLLAQEARAKAKLRLNNLGKKHRA